MAQLKIFRGTSEQLGKVTQKVDGQVYFTTDTNNMFFDILDENGEEQRVQLNAKIATEIMSLAEEEQPHKTAKYEDLWAKASQHTLVSSNWQSGEGDVGPFTQKIDMQNLTCGEAGNVPPIITLTGKTSIDDYNKIETADAEPGDGITFSCNEKPSGNIEIIIIDLA